jgi:putative MATE family efflux protein
MSLQKKNKADLPLAALAVPICLENLFRSALNNVDIIMLSQYSGYAVAAVGLIARISFFLLLLYSMVSSGASVLISQYLGARKEEKAGDTAVAAFVLGTIFSICMSCAICLGAHVILSMYTLEEQVYTYAYQYLTIIGAGSIFLSFNIIQGSIMRSYGYAGKSMAVNMISNIFNITGNALALFGPDWFPLKGVSGVAIATIASRGLSCIILAICIAWQKDILIPWKNILKIPRDIYRKLLKIGVPTGGENLSYNIMTIIIGIPVSQFGTAALNAHIYLDTITRFVFMPAFSIGMATQIKTGYLTGAREFDRAEKKVWSYYFLGLGISTSLILMVILFQNPLFGIFTKDPAVLVLIPHLLIICFFREIGRAANVVVIPGLKGAGDVRFPVAVGIASMWGIAAGGGFLLGKGFGLGISGIWIALTADEILRGIIMLFRWKSGIWRTMGLVDDTTEPAPVTA